MVGQCREVLGSVVVVAQLSSVAWLEMRDRDSRAASGEAEESASYVYPRPSKRRRNATGVVFRRSARLSFPELVAAGGANGWVRHQAGDKCYVAGLRVGAKRCACPSVSFRIFLAFSLHITHIDSDFMTFTMCGSSTRQDLSRAIVSVARGFIFFQRVLSDSLFLKRTAPRLHCGR